MPSSQWVQHKACYKTQTALLFNRFGLPTANPSTFSVEARNMQLTLCCSILRCSMLYTYNIDQIIPKIISSGERDVDLEPTLREV